MLFRKKTVNEKIEHLVKKNDFYELADYVHGTKEEKIDLATALGANDNNSSVDLLLRLIDDNDRHCLCNKVCWSGLSRHVILLFRAIAP